MRKQDFFYFEKLLWKHRQNLESLVVIVPPSPRIYEEQEEDQDPEQENDEVDANLPVSINFPAFPNLIKLNFGWDANKCNENVQDITFSFPDGVINYEKDLPSLKSLGAQKKQATKL